MEPELTEMTAASDNLLCYRLGLMAAEVGRLGPDKCGDEIDRGLIMLQLMNERGLKVFYYPNELKSWSPQQTLVGGEGGDV